jgi:hypothetical protein
MLTVARLEEYIEMCKRDPALNPRAGVERCIAVPVTDLLELLIGYRKFLAVAEMIEG